MMIFHEISAFLQQLHTTEGLRQLVAHGGLILLIAIIFAETGLLVGFFLPGDSLLITAGVFAGTTALHGVPLFELWHLLLFLSLAATIGDQCGFYLGQKTGPLIFKRDDSLFFKRRYVESAHEFYLRHGKWALVLARFAPFLRTFVPFAAGVAKMPYGAFVRYNIFGGLLWIFSMVLLGYYLGKSPLADQLHKILILVVFLSVLPVIISGFKALQKSRKGR